MMINTRATPTFVNYDNFVLFAIVWYLVLFYDFVHATSCKQIIQCTMHVCDICIVIAAAIGSRTKGS